jgi:hypothetical protein
MQTAALLISLHSRRSELAVAKSGPQRDDGLVAEREFLSGARTWFVDVRSPTRRMAVTVHPDRGIAIISLWQAEKCTATFRMPLHDSPGLIAALAEGLAATNPGPPSADAAPVTRLRRVR